MLKRSLQSIATTWLAGLLILLPLALTLGVLGWIVSLLNRFLGPGSLVGRVFAALGYPFSSNPMLAYLFGSLLLIAAIYLLGLIVQAGLAPVTGLDRTDCCDAFRWSEGSTVWPIASSVCSTRSRKPTSALKESRMVPCSGVMARRCSRWRQARSQSGSATGITSPC
jgi:hypothetical protein